MRKPLIAGNWKMFKTNVEAMELVRELAPLLEGLGGAETAVCPPFTALADVARILAELGSAISLGAQDVYPGEEGAFTGEVSPAMLKAVGVTYVIAGHSERREIMGEQDAFIARKLRAVIDSAMTPILCVGETLQEREAGGAATKVQGQLEAGLKPLEAGEAAGIVVAYEPIWAIGTGRTATPEDAQEMCSFIRGWVAAARGEDTAAALRVLYGGSVKPDNAREILAMEDIDGALVGGASLKAGDFAAIVAAVE